MGADEFYDSVGEVVSYILSAEDFIQRQINSSSGIHFVINRDNVDLDFYASPQTRYFTLIYHYSLSNKLKKAYEKDNDLLREHMDSFGIDDDMLRDENLNGIVAYERIKNGDDEEPERVNQKIRSLYYHSDCRLEDQYISDPQRDAEENEVWDGLAVIGLLYPFEDSFGPRQYELVAQEVISVGEQVHKAMSDLEMIKELDRKLNDSE